MCGIIGYSLANPAPRFDLEAAVDALAHRGPDGRGVKVHRTASGRTIGLGHRRLSIVDLSAGGAQPMTSRSKRSMILFNGEIYNHKGLRKELIEAGLPIQTSSDTEVLIEGLEHYGLRFVSRLRGMFAFAFVDMESGTVSLVRDRLGVKPLYIYRASDGFYFSSELRPLLALPWTLDAEALDAYLAWGSVPEPMTLAREVRVVEPGTQLVIDGMTGRETTSSYWQLPLIPSAVDVSSHAVEASAERITALFAESVALRMEADVPVGVFLSSGIDSSAIAKVAAEQARHPIQTFTVTYEGGAHEGVPAEAFARRIGAKHASVHLSNETIVADAEQALRSQDVPSMDGFNTYLVSRAARQAGLKVALSGIGGDEIFAGYTTFRTFGKLARWVDPLRLRGDALRLGFRFGRVNRALALADVRSLYGEYAWRRQVYSMNERDRLLGKSFQSPLHPTNLRIQELWRRGGLDRENALGLFELQNYLRHTLLRDSDTMSMANSLEIREPLLDHLLVEEAFRIPGPAKIRPGENKWLLAKAASLPTNVTRRPKVGFALPYREWLSSGRFRPLLEAAQGELSSLGFHEKNVQELLHDSRVSTSKVWALLSLASWHRQVSRLSTCA